MFRKHIFARMGYATKLAFCLAAISGSVFLSCIDRDNPFDPLNYTAVNPGEIRQKLQPSFDSLWAKAVVLGNQLSGIRLSMAADSAALSQRMNELDSIRKSNAALRALNQAYQIENTPTTPADSLRSLLVLDTLPYFQAQAQLALIRPKRNDVGLLRDRLLFRLDSINQAYFPVKIYNDIERTGKQLGYDSIYRIGDTLLADSLRWGQKLGADIKAWGLENQGILSENMVIQKYNDSLKYVRLRGNRPLIVNADTLSKKITSLIAGDTLYLDTGVFVGRIKINASGTAERPILIQGSPFGGTVLKGGDVANGELLSIDNQRNLIFRDLVFRDAKNSGARVTSNSESIIFERCDFINNEGRGLEISSADVLIRNCRFIGNRGSGIRFTSSGNPNSAQLVNVLIVHNGEYGIDGVDLKGSMGRVTIADNQVDGLKFAGTVGGFGIYSSLIVFNSGFGINLNSAPPSALENLVFSNCNVYGNALADFSQSLPPASPPLLNVDPGFISRDTTVGLNYGLIPESPLKETDIGWRSGP